jgi:uncharacterized protein
VIRWLLALLLLIGAEPGLAQSFPPLSGRVVDAANVIPDAEETVLTAKLKALEDNSGRQLVVATIPSLEGHPIDDYGYRLGRAWQIGEKGKNNGLILLVAPNDRRVRIEVGYGLEPIMTDALSEVIIGTQITPRFKAGDLPGGINAGVDAIIPQLSLPADQATQRGKQLVAQHSQTHKQINFGTVLFWFFIFIFVILPILRSMTGRGGRRYGAGPVIIWGGGLGGGSSWGGGGGGSSWGDGGGGFSGGGGSFGGGGASGGW